MCGLAGFLVVSRSLCEASLIHRVRRMADALAHRGPDDAAAWADADCGIALGHRRLSIVDLSPSGRQPMVSDDGRYVVVLNGEIYNHLELRQRLEAEGHTRWSGHSDTEVFLSAVVRWGLRRALERSVGMFALALWDRTSRTLHLVRDRMGEKPLYYGWLADAFVFGSELKALRRHPEWNGQVDRSALALYLRHGYVPAPHSIYAGIHKLSPGTIATVSLSRAHSQSGTHPELEQFWSAKAVAAHGAERRFEHDSEHAVDRLEQLLEDAVRNQMVADVPVGAFLSGGVDSSVIVALMQKQSVRPIRTFTIGFHDPSYDEAPHARAVAKHLGTQHDEHYVGPAEAQTVVPSLPDIYDEPFADPSQIPTFLLARRARRQVKVCLSGDGGDELFGGYPRYRQGMRLWRWLQLLSPGLRGAVAHFASRQLIPIAERAKGRLGLPDLIGILDPRAGDRLAKIADILGAEPPEAFYRTLLTHWRRPSRVVLGSSEPNTALNDPAEWPPWNGIAERMMYLDAVTYLPDDILVKVDRAAMASSLETRMPMLDDRIVQFAWSLPEKLKIVDGAGKWVLRQVLDRHIPRALTARPKMGFGVPVAAWLRGPLRDWAETLLEPRRMQDEGFFDIREIRRKWSEHVSGAKDWQYLLWDVLMFQAWFEAQRAPLAPRAAPVACA